MPEEHLLGQIIPLQYHYNLLTDRQRLAAFREAIDLLVWPGAKVVDLGGGTGILSYFAAQKAAKVWYVECNPELVRVAEGFLARNSHGDRVEVVMEDAHDFVPPEPVDVVVCEMLHVALLREKQAAVIRAFRQNYARHFAGQVPTFVPEISLLAFQAIQQSFDFAGFYAPISIFQSPAVNCEGTVGLSDPIIYETIDYRGADFNPQIPSRVDWQGNLTITRPGTLNALRFVTKNVLAVVEEQGRAVEWSNQYLVLPLPQPMDVQAGEVLEVAFSYPFGDSLDSLSRSIRVTQASQEKLPATA